MRENFDNFYYAQGIYIGFGAPQAKFLKNHDFPCGYPPARGVARGVAIMVISTWLPPTPGGSLPFLKSWVLPPGAGGSISVSGGGSNFELGG